MKNLLALGLILSFSLPALADFFDEHDRLFKNHSLCEQQAPDQMQAEREFKEMFAILKQDETQEDRSRIQVEDYTAYSTRLKDVSTGNECTIIFHEDCYSAYCE